MDDRRRFFRIKNEGNILASYNNNSLDVINISSSGALVIKNETHLDPNGILKLTILNQTLAISYEVLRKEEQFTTLIFTKENEIAHLFTILKQLKNHQP